jgi:Bacterial Ig-like domain (group 3)
MGIAAGDFNNDGKLDLVLVIPTEGGPGIEIFIQKLDTLTTLSANPSHAIEGQTVNLIAIVAPASATGTVTFTEGTTILGTVPLADGEAVFTTSSLSLGAHLITATYSGDINFSSSEGLVSVYVQTISITALSINPNPTYIGQNTNLTALVTPASATGTVTFTTGSTILGTAPLLNGIATLTINTLPAGTYIILANYNGDSNFLGSASAALTLVVQPAIKPVILPPQHLKGSKKTTLFATQTDYINILKWQAPRSGSQPITYHIYRDSQLTELVAVIQANQALKYYDHNRKKRELYTYYVISIDPLGNQSAAVSVTIRG